MLSHTEKAYQLRVAPSRGNLQTAECLLGEQYNKFKLRVYAFDNKLIDVENLIRIKENEYYLAMQLGDLQAARYILQNYVNFINSQSESGYTALMLAAKNGNSAIVNLLLSRLARTDLVSTGLFDRHNSALMLAAEGGFYDIVRSLLDASAPIDQQNNHGATALNLAVFSGHTSIVRLLLDYGADLRYLPRNISIKKNGEVIAKMIHEEQEKIYVRQVACIQMEAIKNGLIPPEMKKMAPLIVVKPQESKKLAPLKLPLKFGLFPPKEDTSTPAVGEQSFSFSLKKG